MFQALGVGSFGLLPSRGRTIAQSREDECGAEDEGEYIPTDSMTNSPQPEPQFVEGCQVAEFKHIKNFFDWGKCKAHIRSNT